MKFKSAKNLFDTKQLVWQRVDDYAAHMELAAQSERRRPSLAIKIVKHPALFVFSVYSLP